MRLVGELHEPAAVVVQVPTQLPVGGDPVVLVDCAPPAGVPVVAVPPPPERGVEVTPPDAPCFEVLPAPPLDVSVEPTVPRVPPSLAAVERRVDVEPPLPLFPVVVAPSPVVWPPCAEPGDAALVPPLVASEPPEGPAGFDPHAIRGKPRQEISSGW